MLRTYLANSHERVRAGELPRKSFPLFTVSFHYTTNSAPFFPWLIANSILQCYFAIYMLHIKPEVSNIGTFIIFKPAVLGATIFKTKMKRNWISKFLRYLLAIRDGLRDLVRFVQFKKREKHPRRSVNFSKVAGFSLQLY